MSSQMDSSISNDCANGAQDNQDELELIKQELKPFAQALTEDIEKKPIYRATAYEIAIAMIADIVIKILDYQEKKIIFPKKVITGLWDVQVGDNSINIIGMLYQFMTICGSYPDADFKKSTYGAIISKKQTGDINYNLDPKQAHIPLKDCKFVLLLKVFRTILGRSIKNTTGKYSIPDEKESKTWRYMVINDARQQKFLTSTEFIQYTLEIGEIYGEIDKLTPQLTEIYEIFNEAAVASKLEKEQKMKRFEARALHQKRSRYYNDEKHRHFTKQNQKSITQKFDWNTVVERPPPPSVWGKINPITQRVLPSASAFISVEQTEQVEVKMETNTISEYVDDDMDGFQVVTRGRKH